MKNLLLLSLLLLVVFYTNAQIVNIPDSIFKAKLVNNDLINTNSDNEIQLSEAVAFTGEINVSLKNIYSLTGIEELRNLKTLLVYYVDLTI